MTRRTPTTTTTTTTTTTKRWKPRTIICSLKLKLLGSSLLLFFFALYVYQILSTALQLEHYYYNSSSSSLAYEFTTSLTATTNHHHHHHYRNTNDDNNNNKTKTTSTGIHPFTWKNGCQVWNNKPLVGTTPPTEHHDTNAPPTGLVVTLLLPSEDPTYQQAIRGLSCNAIPWLAYPGKSWHWWYSLFRRFRIHQSHHFRVVHNLPLPPLGTQVVVVYHWESNRWLAHGQWQRGSSLVVKSPRWVQ